MMFPVRIKTVLSVAVALQSSTACKQTFLDTFNPTKGKRKKKKTNLKDKFYSTPKTG